MKITVKFFAALREQLGASETAFETSESLTVGDVWQRASGGRPLPANTLAAINMEYTALSAPLKDGDEVAFFPPVTGG